MQELTIINSGWDHVKVMITPADLEALDSALDRASRSLELELRDLEKISLIDGVMQTGINATIAREAMDSIKKHLDTLEKLSEAIYTYQTGSR